MQKIKNYGTIKGTVLIIGYGSIGKGTLPLIKKHFSYDKIVIIDPVEEGPNDKNIQCIKVALTQSNYIDILNSVFGQKTGFCVNLSVGTSSKDIMLYCQEKQILYIDTVIEQWQGFYSNEKTPIKDRSNYALRQRLREAVRNKPFKSTAISCCGANPGMVSWFVKQALLNIAHDTSFKIQKFPNTRKQWALLMKELGVKGIHVAERDTQKCDKERPIKQFWNTWSVDGYLSQAFYQAAELGFGTHQKWKPKHSQQFNKQIDGGPCHALLLNKSGMNARVNSWCPTLGPQFGFLVTHNQSISISDYFTVKQGDKVIFRPTVHYAYHPTQYAISSTLQCLSIGKPLQQWKILVDEIVDGADQLGVLIFGHAKNAYWYGSQLNIHQTRKRAPNQNATALQVTSAVLAGMVWALQNLQAGTVQTQQMDFKRCLQIQQQYIAPVNGYYTDWTPLDNVNRNIESNNIDEKDPWQFKNILIPK